MPIPVTLESRPGVSDSRLLRVASCRAQLPAEDCLLLQRFFQRRWRYWFRRVIHGTESTNSLHKSGIVCVPRLCEQTLAKLVLNCSLILATRCDHVLWSAISTLYLCRRWSWPSPLNRWSSMAPQGQSRDLRRMRCQTPGVSRRISWSPSWAPPVGTAAAAAAAAAAGAGAGCVPAATLLSLPVTPCSAPPASFSDGLVHLFATPLLGFRS
jgi:hypothetical protein